MECTYKYDEATLLSRRAVQNDIELNEAAKNNATHDSTPEDAKTE